jgi:hypothetical protein
VSKKVTVERCKYDIYKQVYHLEMDEEVVQTLTTAELLQLVTERGRKVDTRFHSEHDKPDSLSIRL